MGAAYDRCSEAMPCPPQVLLGSMRSAEDTAPARLACPKGSRCRNRSKAHLDAEAHPLDSDYMEIVAATPEIVAEQLTLKVLFDWTDRDDTGKITREELNSSFDLIKKACGDLPDITDEAWHHLDEDGNGVVNFGEFAAWAGPRLGLPLGLKFVLHRADAGSKQCSPCSVIGCPCEDFNCKKASGKVCKICKHKKRLHLKSVKQQGDVPYPVYWDHMQKSEFTELVELRGKKPFEEFQSLLTKTYRPNFTRDRAKHNPSSPNVPKGYTIKNIYRNENSHNWKEYCCRLNDVLTRIGEGGAKIAIYDQVKSTVAWCEIQGAKADRLARQANEWYLFHGTSPDAAKSICATDFKVSRAGSNTGTLYGKGLYFAESITKADEYAKPNANGIYAVLLCRVIGGNVLYTDEVTPDPEHLVYECITGDYDSVLGDREKRRGTFKEHVIFDSEDVYPEYVIEYTRNM